VIDTDGAGYITSSELLRSLADNPNVNPNDIATNPMADEKAVCVT
jgi:hypothetical protein